jgi:hypothetical protein
VPNLRIISANAADTSTLTASTTAGALAAANMLTDYKGQVHRSTGTSVTYTLTWAAAQSIGAVVLPACNLSASATIRVRLYSDTAGTTQIADSGTVSACPGLDLSWWGGTVNANSFAYGALAKVAVWFASNYATARRCVIDLVDTSNAAGYIDCARLVVGAWWSPAYNASYGLQFDVQDTSEPARNDAGDLLSDRGVRFDTLSLDLKLMPEADRASLLNIVRAVGTSRNLLLSLLPANAAAPAAERDCMVYGKRANAALSRDMPTAYSTKLEMEGW